MFKIPFLYVYILYMNAANMDEVQPVATIINTNCDNEPTVDNVFSNDTEISSCVLRTIAYVDAHHDFKGKGIYYGHPEILKADIKKELGAHNSPTWLQGRYTKGSDIENHALQDWIPQEAGASPKKSVIDLMTLSESDYTKSSNDLVGLIKYVDGSPFTETNLLANGYTGIAYPTKRFLASERHAVLLSID